MSGNKADSRLQTSLSMDRTLLSIHGLNLWQVREIREALEAEGSNTASLLSAALRFNEGHMVRGDAK